MDSLDKVLKTRAQRDRVESQTGRKLAHDEHIDETDAPSDILGEDGDPEKKAQMGILLKTLLPDAAKQQALQDAFASKGPFSKEQLKLMRDVRFEFNERTALLEEAKRLFTADEIQHLVNRNSRYANVMSQFPPERAKELADMHFSSIAMGDVKKLRKIIDEKKEIEERKKTPEYKLLQTQVEWACQRAGMTAEQLTAAVDLTDRAGSQQRLREKIKEEYDKIPNRPYRWFKKACDWAFDRSGTAANDVIQTLEDTQRAVVVGETNANMDVIARTLAATIQKRPEFITALSLEMFGGEKVQLEGIEQVLSAKDVEKRRADISDKTLKVKWNSEKEALAKAQFKKKYSALSDPEKGTLRDSFLDETEKNAKARGTTIFASILESIIGTLFGTHRANKDTLLP